jgi:transcription-repair coupling factor (superfamily II helicase)
VRELKGEEIEDDVRASVNLRVDLKIDHAYIPDMNQRLMVYRQMASARRDDELEQTLAEVRDRYGPLPDSVRNLADYGRIRIMADRLGVESLDREGQTVVIRFRQQARVDPDRLVQIVGRRGDLSMVPPAGLRLDLRTAGGRPPSRLASSPAPPASPRVLQGARGGAGTATPAWPNFGRKPVTSTDLLGPNRRDSRSDSAAPASWWTARATSGEVAPGFTKAEMTRPAAEDPRAETGVFTKVGGLLGELLGPTLG